MNEFDLAQEEQVINEVTVDVEEDISTTRL